MDHNFPTKFPKRSVSITTHHSSPQHTPIPCPSAVMIRAPGRPESRCNSRDEADVSWPERRSAFPRVLSSRRSRGTSVDKWRWRATPFDRSAWGRIGQRRCEHKASLHRGRGRKGGEQKRDRVCLGYNNALNEPRLAYYQRISRSVARLFLIHCSIRAPRS